jgi:RNA polymerase sigma factor (sigma-70 family)
MDGYRTFATQELVRRCQAGDRVAGGTLYERLFPKLRACAVLRMGTRGLTHPEEVDDVVQDVFKDVLERLGGGGAPDLQGPDVLRAYLRRAIHNMVVTYGRRRARRREQAFESGGSRSVPARAPGPVTSSCVRDSLSAALRRVEEALVDLPPHYRNAIALRYLCEMDSAAIVAELALPGGEPAKYFRTEAQVRTTLFHAMARLREALAQDSLLVEDYFDALESMTT